MTVTISKTTTITMSGTQITVRELSRVLAGLPEEAKISITQYKGDQRDPGYVTITVRES